ncbi:MAG: S8 family serine peptidase, partial [Candidatus Dadabacteria bacterium]|nr:S8 family serine peptidase [Candidatus Dadabacteria bacterium]
GSGEPCNNTIAGCDHGTHVAGIAAGWSDGTYPVGPGVASDANIIAIQVFTEFADAGICGGFGLPTPCALTYASDQIAGLQRVYDLRFTYDISTVNMSLGGGKYTAACDGDSRKAIIDLLRAAGIATVISSGNNGYSDGMGAPACISTAISVGSTTVDSWGFPYVDDTVSTFSNSASFLDLLAPGQVIYSSVPGDVYGWKQGTSMAAPHVAGAWALLKQQNSSITVDDALL